MPTYLHDCVLGGGGLCQYPGFNSARAARTLLKQADRKQYLLICFFSLLRNMLTLLLFIARAFISGGFQAAYVYTPEVGGVSGSRWGRDAGSAVSRHTQPRLLGMTFVLVSE